MKPSFFEGIIWYKSHAVYNQHQARNIAKGVDDPVVTATNRQGELGDFEEDFNPVIAALGTKKSVQTIYYLEVTSPIKQTQVPGAKNKGRVLLSFFKLGGMKTVVINRG